MCSDPVHREALEARGAPISRSQTGEAALFPALLNRISPEKPVSTATVNGSRNARAFHIAVTVRLAGGLIELSTRRM